MTARSQRGHPRVTPPGPGSASLVCAGVLRNRPREAHGIEIAGGRPVTTALPFTPR